jgi:hypothetical protein
VFEDFARYYGFTPRACQPYRARTKGKVESGVKYVKRNALAGRRFASWDDLNTWLEQWSRTVADLRVHGTTHERPIDRFARERLVPLGSRPPYKYEQVKLRRVANDALVAVGAAGIRCRLSMSGWWWRSMKARPTTKWSTRARSSRIILKPSATEW